MEKKSLVEEGPRRRLFALFVLAILGGGALLLLAVSLQEHYLWTSFSTGFWGVLWYLGVNLWVFVLLLTIWSAAKIPTID